MESLINISGDVLAAHTPHKRTQSLPIIDLPTPVYRDVDDPHEPHHGGLRVADRPIEAEGRVQFLDQRGQQLGWQPLVIVLTALRRVGPQRVHFLPLLPKALDVIWPNVLLIFSSRHLALKVLKDHRNEKIEHNELAEEDERSKVDNRDNLTCTHAVVHDTIPRLTGGHAVHNEHRIQEIAEIGMLVQEVSFRQVPKQVHPGNRVHEEEEEEERSDVHQRRERRRERFEQGAQAGRCLHESEDASYTDDAQYCEVQRY
mmetsp:Transcript_158814/g.385754  ORF Transcript_158814/g.385754 Transcript_158814/m.385754 type:complete len:258 (-) Transcript_158814:115-888(-)